MEISISGKNIKLGESLEQYVAERLKTGIKKLIQDFTHAEVVFSKNGHIFLATILIREGHGLGMIRSNFASDEIYHSFDGAFIRLEKQLRKYKDKYHDHRAKKITSLELGEDLSLSAKKYVLSAETPDAPHDQHLIIAEKATNIECLEVSEAVMKMDLNHVPALLFKNKSNGRLNIVFYRADGNISWIDPEGI